MCDDIEVVTTEEPRQTPTALELGRALAQARRAAGVSQDRLAERTGVQQALISRIECGKANPTLKTVDTLAQGLGLRLSVAFVPVE